MSPLCYPSETEWAKAFEAEVHAGTTDTHFFPRRFSTWSPQCLNDYRPEHVPDHQEDEFFAEQELPGSCTTLRAMMWNLLDPATEQIVELLPIIDTPTLIIWGRDDKVLDIDYARRLITAGVPAELHVYPGGCHAFDGMVPDADISKRFTADIHRALRKALHQ